MLIGTYRHSLDAKKRMRMPSKFKTVLGNDFVITKGTGENLLVFSKAEFDNLYQKLSNIPLFDVEAQKPVRMLLASAFESEEDNQGRVLLPKELVLYAKIQKDIVFIGVGNRVEIWAEEVWNKISAENDTDFSVLAKFGV